MNKYRIKPYDLMSNIWALQVRKLFFFWKTVGYGPQDAVEKQCRALNFRWAT